MLWILNENFISLSKNSEKIYTLYTMNTSPYLSKTFLRLQIVDFLKTYIFRF